MSFRVKIKLCQRIYQHGLQHHTVNASCYDEYIVNPAFKLLLLKVRNIIRKLHLSGCSVRLYHDLCINITGTYNLNVIFGCA